MHIPPDWAIFFTLIVSFLVFWNLFGRLFFSPFLKLIDEREHRLKDLGERTERLLQEERAAIEERESQLAAVRREAMSRRESERRRAEEEAAQRQLGELARTLAAELAGRVLERPVIANGNLGNGNLATR